MPTSNDNVEIRGILVAGSARALHAAPRRVLDERDVYLLSDVSARLMRDPVAKTLPDVMSFAFWCRKGHLGRLAGGRVDLAHSLGRGLAFHVAPSNVPVNFAFSWAFALLAGNANVVRVPSKPFPQVKVICDAAQAAMDDAGDERTAFVSYPSSSDVTERFCSLADVRVIWGGDRTVGYIRQMPSGPRCVDVAFADRYSIAVIDAGAVLAAGDKELSALAKGFYNDTYFMDQNACSSPMTVCWVNACGSGEERFWSAVRAEAAARYNLQGAVATDKYVQVCRDAIEGRSRGAVKFDALLNVVGVDLAGVPEGALDRYRGKGGYFYEADISSFEAVLTLLGRTCQTVTYFGVDPDELREKVITLGSSGVDRIVPVGKAMDIDLVWDGMDLLSMMSRRIDVRWA